MQINFSSTSSDQAPGLSGKLGMSCLFGMFLLMGSIGAFALANEAYKNARTRSWTEVPCTILSVDAKPTRPPYKLAISYRYEWKGRRFTGGSIAKPTKTFDKWIDVQHRLDDFLPGTESVCYVDPEKPSRSQLEHESLWVGLFVLIPLLFAGVGLGGLWFTWFYLGGGGDKAPMSSTATENSNRMPPLFGIPFFGIFFVVGCIAFKFVFLDTFVTVRAAESWPEVKCTVVHSWVESHSSDDGTTYSVEVLFRYAFEGRTRHADTFYAWSTSSSGRSSKARVVKQYPPGREVTCRVNPQDPAQAYIQPDPGAGLWLGLLTLIFVAVGGAGLIWTFKGMMATPVPCPVSDHLRGPDDDAEQIHHTDWLPDYRELDGAADLSPMGKRVWKLVGIIAISLFWNGIVSVFAYQVWKGWSTGHGDVMLSLFLTPFLLVGIGFVCAICYYALGLFNPAPHLQVADAVPHLGETFALRWGIDSGLNRIERLRIDIEGTEHATYRRGTDTVTDTEVFARFPLVDTIDPLEMAGGEASLPLPRDAMHTLTTGNNQITWALKVRGDIPFWPDIDDEYEIIFLPAVPERT